MRSFVPPLGTHHAIYRRLAHSFPSLFPPCHSLPSCCFVLLAGQVDEDQRLLLSSVAALLRQAVESAVLPTVSPAASTGTGTPRSLLHLLLEDTSHHSALHRSLTLAVLGAISSDLTPSLSSLTSASVSPSVPLPGKHQPYSVDSLRTYHQASPAAFRSLSSFSAVLSRAPSHPLTAPAAAPSSCGLLPSLLLLRLPLLTTCIDDTCTGLEEVRYPTAWHCTCQFVFCRDSITLRGTTLKPHVSTWK